MNLYECGLGSIRPRHLLSYSNTVEWLSKLTGGFAEPWAFCRRAALWLAKHRDEFDIVHDNQSLGYGLLKIQRMKIPLITTIHHPISRDLKIALQRCDNSKQRILLQRWYSFIKMQGKVARSLHHLTAVSDSTKRDVVTDFEVDQNKISVIHNGIDTEIYRPRSEIERHPWRIVCIASSDHPLKGVNYLLPAIAKLSKKFSMIELIIVGPLNNNGATAALIDRLELNSRVSFVHGLSGSEIAGLYASATLAVVPSLYEGFGFPAGEAMACGTALVSTNAGALPEITGAAAVSVPPASSDALAEAISALLVDSDRRQKMQKMGIQRIGDQFTWQQTATKLSTLYEQIIDSTKR